MSRYVYPILCYAALRYVAYAVRIHLKAEEIAHDLGHYNFRYSRSWIHRFKAHHKFIVKQVCGECTSVNVESVSVWQSTTLPSLLEGYKPSDVFNADEMGLYFCLLPNKTLEFKNEPCHGGKQEVKKDCQGGSKINWQQKAPLLVIRKTKNPRCFKECKLGLVCNTVGRPSGYLSW